MAIRIRLAERGDLEAINAIYNHYVLTSTATYQEEPATMAEREAWFELHTGGGEKHPATVAVSEKGEVLGWGSLSKFHPRSAYRFTVEDSIYVREEEQGRGVGRALLADLLTRAKALGHRQVVALISADQPRSIRLHERAGFKHVGVLHGVGVKFGRGLDLALMQLAL